MQTKTSIFNIPPNFPQGLFKQTMNPPIKTRLNKKWDKSYSDVACSSSHHLNKEGGLAPCYNRLKKVKSKA